MDNFDICVIGGGPAGIMAAGAAKTKYEKVLLLEKNNQLGKSFLLQEKEGVILQIVHL